MSMPVEVRQHSRRSGSCRSSLASRSTTDGDRTSCTTANMLCASCIGSRDLVFLAEEQGAMWAADLKELLLDMKQATVEARKPRKLWLDPLEVLAWEARFLDLLAEGDRLHPRAVAPPGRRGRCKQSRARNLLDRLRKPQKAVLTFLEDLRVDFDNNLAERDLRMVKVQQKVSGCFRSLVGAQAFARIRGYLSTLRKQGLPLLSSLQATLCGHPVLPSLQRT